MCFAPGKRPHQTQMAAGVSYRLLPLDPTLTACSMKVTAENVRIAALRGDAFLQAPGSPGRGDARGRGADAGRSLTMLERIAAVCGVALKLHAEEKPNFDMTVAFRRAQHDPHLANACKTRR